MSVPIPGLLWVDDAPCISEPDLFHSAGPFSRIKAKRLCAGCPYQQLCLANALAIDDDWGIWGGTDPEERRLLSHPARANRLPPASPRRTA